DTNVKFRRYLLEHWMPRFLRASLGRGRLDKRKADFESGESDKWSTTILSLVQALRAPCWPHVSVKTRIAPSCCSRLGPTTARLTRPRTICCARRPRSRTTTGVGLRKQRRSAKS